MVNVPGFILGLLLFLFGSIIIIYGWKIHQQIIGLSGLVFGSVLGNFIFTAFIDQKMQLLQLLIVPVFGLLSLIGFLVFERWALSIAGGLVGALVVSGFTSTRTIIDWSSGVPIFAPHYNYLALLSAFLAFTYASHRFFKLGYIFLSTCIGSILISYGGVGIGIWGYDHLGVFLLLSLMIGVIKQLYSEGIDVERRNSKDKFKYCTSCGAEIIGTSLMCSQCGKALPGKTNTSKEE